MSLKEFWNVLKKSVSEWSEDKAPRLAAALAYYTVFSIPPLLVIVISIAGLALGREAVQSAILGQIAGLIGPESSQAVGEMIASAGQTGTGTVATIIGVLLLLLGASGVFGQLQDSLNTIWEVEPKPNQGFFGMIRKRFFSFTLVVGIGFLLLVSLVLTAALGAAGDYLVGLFPGFETVMQVINFVVSFLVIMVLFALMFKFVPDAKIAWGDVWLGAAITSLLFTVGRTIIGLYLGNSETASNFGAASSVVIILLWVYYSAQILFFGAEFTQVYANELGSRIVPEEGAQRVGEEARAQQGIPRREPSPGIVGTPGPLQPGLVPVTATERRLHQQYRPDLRPSPLRLIQAAQPLIVAVLVGVVGGAVMVREEKRQLSEDLIEFRKRRTEAAEVLKERKRRRRFLFR
ncbi:MAG: YihY/virulence factor BrkB family protein [Chloroflexota bacterium]|nr:MAG: YihY/virulence factor BrkB family protein [Chloroflexota bacterium]